MLGTGRAPALRLKHHITAEDAIKVFRRKVAGAEVTVQEVFHPFWWTSLAVHTRGIIPSRKPAVPAASPSMHVLVNAQSGRGFLAEFEPKGEELTEEEWEAALDLSGFKGDYVSTEDAQVIARALVRTKVIKTVKLGMSIKLEERIAPRAVLKPNWIVTGANDKFAATMLVDGLDSSHYIVRAEKLTAAKAA